MLNNYIRLRQLWPPGLCAITWVALHNNSNSVMFDACEKCHAMPLPSPRPPLWNLIITMMGDERQKKSEREISIFFVPYELSCRFLSTRSILNEKFSMEIKSVCFAGNGEEGEKVEKDNLLRFVTSSTPLSEWNEFPASFRFQQFFFSIFLLLNSDLLRFNRGHRGEPSSKCPKISIDFDLASWTEAKASEWEVWWGRDVKRVWKEL